jgi:hypothetical protein
VPILLSFGYKELAEETAQVVVVRFFVESQTTSIIEKNAEHRWASRVKTIEGEIHLQLEDCLVFLPAGRGPDAMPGKRSTEEVYKNIGE